MKSNPEQLDSSQVLSSLRREPEPRLGAELEARLLQRLELGIASLPMRVPSGSGGADEVLARGSLVDTYSASLALHPVATFVGTLVLGGVLGALAHAGIVDSKDRPVSGKSADGPALVLVPRDAASAVPESATIPVDALPLLHSVPEVPQVLQVPRSRPAAKAALPNPSQGEPKVPEAPDATLAEQVAELEAARGALARKDTSAALRTLESHALRYPQSRVTEERSALLIKTLVLAHRHSEARTRLRQFEQEFPNSLLLPALRDSVNTIP